MEADGGAGTAVDVEQVLAEIRRLPAVTPTASPTIKKLGYTHEAMIDMIMAEPDISQNELGARFGYSASWISTILASNVMKAKLAERREAIIDPILRMRVSEQLEGLMLRSLEILRDKLKGRPDDVPDQLALRTFELSSRAAGYGARTENKVQVNVTQHIEAHGEQLVGLLRRKKDEVNTIEVEAHEVK